MVAGRIDAELVDDQEIVVDEIVPIEEANGRVTFAVEGRMCAGRGAIPGSVAASGEVAAGGAVDVGRDIALVPVTGGGRPGRLEHQDRPAG